MWFQRNRQKQGRLSVLHASGKWSKVQIKKCHPLWAPHTMSDHDKYSVRRMVECKRLRIQWWGVGNGQEKTGMTTEQKYHITIAAYQDLCYCGGKYIFSIAAQAKIFHTQIYDMSLEIQTPLEYKSLNVYNWRGFSYYSNMGKLINGLNVSTNMSSSIALISTTPYVCRAKHKQIVLLFYLVTAFYLKLEEWKAS